MGDVVLSPEQCNAVKALGARLAAEWNEPYGLSAMFTAIRDLQESGEIPPGDIDCVASGLITVTKL